jgi:hypothetical protein
MLALVGMIEDGPKINSPRFDSMPQSTISMAQLLQYNSSVCRRPENTGVHHSKTRETPLAVYVGLTVHARTRKRDHIDLVLGYLSLMTECWKYQQQ